MSIISGQSDTQILAIVLLFIGMFVMFWTVLINLRWPQGTAKKLGVSCNWALCQKWIKVE